MKIDDLPTDEELDNQEITEYYDRDDYDIEDDMSDLEAAYYAYLCADDENFKAEIRKMYIGGNVNSDASLDELYLKSVIKNKKDPLSQMIHKQYEYEQSWKKQEKTADML